jgi:phosphoribosylanthranilate isomerase
MSVKIKICGITNIDDAQLVDQLGADFIGLNFIAQSPRCVTSQQAEKIIARLSNAKPIGIFAEHTDEAVNQLATALGLFAVQLYRSHHLQNTKYKIIQALRIKTASELNALSQIAAEYILLDAHHDAMLGGSGYTFNWQWLPPNLNHIFLAGGITPQNIKQAMQYQPYAIDLCSGVESTPGKKDPQKCQQLFQEIL